MKYSQNVWRTVGRMTQQQLASQLYVFRRSLRFLTTNSLEILGRNNSFRARSLPFYSLLYRYFYVVHCYDVVVCVGWIREANDEYRHFRYFESSIVFHVHVCVHHVVFFAVLRRVHCGYPSRASGILQFHHYRMLP